MDLSIIEGFYFSCCTLIYKIYDHLRIYLYIVDKNSIYVENVIINQILISEESKNLKNIMLVNLIENKIIK